MPCELFDLSGAQQGKPFEIVFSFPDELAKQPGAQLRYRLTDLVGGEVKAGLTPVAAGTDGMSHAVVSIDRQTAQTVYLRGRLRASLIIEDAGGAPIYSGNRELDHLSFAKRDDTPLPALPETNEDTPYGKLKLVDEIDCSTSIFDEPHPYHSERLRPRATARAARLGRGREGHGNPRQERRAKANTAGSPTAWGAASSSRTRPTSCASNIPEDKPRIVPIELQSGQNFHGCGLQERRRRGRCLRSLAAQPPVAVVRHDLSRSTTRPWAPAARAPHRRKTASGFIS